MDQFKMFLKSFWNKKLSVRGPVAVVLCLCLVGSVLLNYRLNRLADGWTAVAEQRQQWLDAQIKSAFRDFGDRMKTTEYDDQPEVYLALQTQTLRFCWHSFAFSSFREDDALNEALQRLYTMAQEEKLIEQMTPELMELIWETAGTGYYSETTAELNAMLEQIQEQ